MLLVLTFFTILIHCAIVRELSKRKIRITQIYSNGFLVNEKLLDMLESYGQKPEFNM